jgi:hypothetical protein
MWIFGIFDVAENFPDFPHFCSLGRDIKWLRIFALELQRSS